MTFYETKTADAIGMDLLPVTKKPPKHKKDKVTVIVISYA